MEHLEPENEDPLAEVETAEDTGEVSYDDAVDAFGGGQSGTAAVDMGTAVADEPDDPETDDLADDPDPVFDDKPTNEAGDQNAGKGPEVVRTADEIAWEQRNLRRQALEFVARNNTGRGVPAAVLAAQAEDLMLWLDGECSAEELEL